VVLLVVLVVLQEMNVVARSQRMLLMMVGRGPLVVLLLHPLVLDGDRLLLVVLVSMGLLLIEVLLVGIL
jgi:hypothetical protein